MKDEDRPLLVRDILRHLDLQKEERRRVRELLKGLAEEGKIVKIRGNRYGFPDKMNLVIGRVKCHPDGYGFVIAETPGEEDVFLSPRNLREAMHGDRVVARVESVRRKGKEGRIIRILERRLQKVVGKFMREKNYSYLSLRMNGSCRRSTSLKERQSGLDPIRSWWQRSPATQRKGQDRRAGSFRSLDTLMIRRWSHRSSFINMIFPSGFQRPLSKRQGVIPLQLLPEEYERPGRFEGDSRPSPSMERRQRISMMRSPLRRKRTGDSNSMFRSLTSATM